jgi:uncharacterized protein YndB with AHSA1/START domain
MANIIHRIGIKASPDKVYRALATIEGLAGWWTVNYFSTIITGVKKLNSWAIAA